MRNFYSLRIFNKLLYNHDNTFKKTRKWYNSFRISVEIARGTPHGRDKDRFGGSSRSGRDRSPRGGGGGGRDRRPSWMDKYGAPERTDYKLIVENLSSRVSWQVSHRSIGAFLHQFHCWTRLDLQSLFGFALSTSPVTSEFLVTLALVNLCTKRRHGFETKAHSSFIRLCPSKAGNPFRFKLINYTYVSCSSFPISLRCRCQTDPTWGWPEGGFPAELSIQSTQRQTLRFAARESPAPLTRSPARPSVMRSSWKENPDEISD